MISSGTVAFLLSFLIIWLGILRTKRRINRYSNELLNPARIELLKKQLEWEARRKPKSIVANTCIYLPRIAKDFPDFNYVEMKSRAETTLVSYLRAIDENNPKKLLNGGEELKESLTLYLDMLRDSGIQEKFDDIYIHRTEISRYMKDPGRCIISFQSALKCRHSKKKDGVVIEGSTEYDYQTKYEMDMVYIQDRDLVESDHDRALGYNCPNCGAPVVSLKVKICEYCGCGIQEYNIKVWTFCAIREIKKVI